MYVDDAAAASADDRLFDSAGMPVIRDGVHLRRAGEHFRIAREVLAFLGWRSAPSKEVPPTTRMESLGVVVDITLGVMCLGDAKRLRYSEQALAVAERSFCDVDVYEQLLGRLQFAVQCYPIGKQRMHAAWRVARARFRVDGAVRVTRAVQRDLRWWAAELSRADHPGVPLAPAASPSVGAGAVAIYTTMSSSLSSMKTANERTCM